MITEKEAQRIVEKELSSYPLPDNDKFIILEDSTITKEWGWVYFYTSEKWHTTGDFRYAIAGNAPFIVEKMSGKLFVTGTAEPIEEYIKRYESSGDPHA